jgi:hypothetical protein
VEFLCRDPQLNLVVAPATLINQKKEKQGERNTSDTPVKAQWKLYLQPTLRLNN